ncbi:hypothetical protein SADUNF_Sadunf14G0019100 [Salix dunnii]|uniref:Apple domain-containing protein n=1 Tax=Salix dunnii TaxID=1413687 RepID=A0A835MPH7_9ROSI|nr:hypothetical protein SADUNF_Sadunf14G0019100 [Salix dunnii]
MARGLKLGCSYKRSTLIVCSINIVVALYVLRSLYASLYLYTNSDYDKVVKYTPDQVRNMEESIRIRREKEPVELVKTVKELKEEFNRGKMVAGLPKEVKDRITDEILQRLRSLNANANVSEQRGEKRFGGRVILVVLRIAAVGVFSSKFDRGIIEVDVLDPLSSSLSYDPGFKMDVLDPLSFLSDAIESWRKQKLQEVKQLVHGTGGLTSSVLQQEAGMIERALESDWDVLSENIGLWVPAEVIHQEHNDKPEDEEEPEEEVLPGRPLPAECRAELHADYGGAAVRWGLTHHKESAADCCQACLDQAKYAKPGEKKCNIWVYCPSETGCYSPDIYEHKNQECWLKYAEKPKLNFKDKYSDWYRDSHPNAPLIVPWVSGVVSA